MRTEEEMNTIYSLYGDSIFKLALSYVRDYATAEDVQKEKSIVMDAVFSLPKQYRLVIHLYYYEGYSVKEIADILEKKKEPLNHLCVVQESF